VVGVDHHDLLCQWDETVLCEPDADGVVHQGDDDLADLEGDIPMCIVAHVDEEPLEGFPLEEESHEFFH